MKTVFSERHRRYQPRFDIVNGRVAETASPARNADIILEAVRRDLSATILPPTDHGLDAILSIHDPAYVNFLQTAWDQWSATYGEGEALPLGRVQRGMLQRVPECIDGQLSYYALDVGTPITEGTWDAVYASAQVTLTAANLLADGESVVYALSRPGGHHAGRDYYGGYCFLSTEGLGIQGLIGRGAERVAYLDVDYHHCNGTQSIFYDRADVLTVSIHCDPRYDYPYFSGFVDERGAGPGAGTNINIPLAPGTRWAAYREALDRSLTVIQRFAPDAVVVLLGVDTFEHDTISQFRLTFDDYPRIGECIGSLDAPILFVKGGGYCEESLDRCVSAVLAGCLDRKS